MGPLTLSAKMGQRHAAAVRPLIPEAGPADAGRSPNRAPHARDPAHAARQPPTGAIADGTPDRPGSGRAGVPPRAVGRPPAPARTQNRETRMAKGDPGATPRGRRAAPRSKRAGQRRPRIRSSYSYSPPTASGSSAPPARTAPSTASTSPTRSTAASTATSSWSASSTPRRPPCSARASWASGPACSARRRRRSAPAGRCARRTWPSRPTASTASSTAAASTRSCRWACSAASTRAAGTRTSSSSTCTRSSSARRPCTPPATPWASPWTAGPARDDGEAVIAYFGDGATSQGDVNEAFIWAERLQRADRLLLPEQPVRDLRAAGAADPHPALPAGGRLRLPRRTGRRQRRARHVRGHPARRWTTPATARARA